MTFQGTQAALISLPNDQGSQIFLLKTGLITHFLLQGVTSGGSCALVHWLLSPQPDHYPGSVGSTICKACSQLDQMVRGAKARDPGVQDDTPLPSYVAHSKDPLPATQEMTLHADITR